MVGVAVNIVEAPVHIGFEPVVIAILTAGVVEFVIVKSLPLFAPEIAGLLLTTLILYPVPVLVATGIVTLILCEPLASDVTACKFVGVVNEPLASDN